MAFNSRSVHQEPTRSISSEKYLSETDTPRHLRQGKTARFKGIITQVTIQTSKIGEVSEGHNFPSDHLWVKKYCTISLHCNKITLRYSVVTCSQKSLPIIALPNELLQSIALSQHVCNEQKTNHLHICWHDSSKRHEARSNIREKRFQSGRTRC